VKCTWIKTGQGVALVCGRLRVPTCAFCGGISRLECDWPAGKKKTCDKKLCRGCALSAGPNVDFCPDHPVPVQALLFAAD
jgi:hypothetical protein